MKRLFVISAVVVLSLALAVSAFAQDNQARVRVVHASPDAPAVDVWVDGSVAFNNAPFQGITDDAGLDAGTYNVQVTPTGATEPVVLDADLGLTAGTDSTVVAVGVTDTDTGSRCSSRTCLSRAWVTICQWTPARMTSKPASPGLIRSP